jgi:WD40 repeat protein
VIICLLAIPDVTAVRLQEDSEPRYEIVAHLSIADASIVSWSPDGSRLAVTAYPTIQIFDTLTWELLLTIPDAPAYSTEWSPDGTMLAGVRGGRGENVLIWDASTGNLLEEMSRLMPNHQWAVIVHDLAWHPDSTRIVTDSGWKQKDLMLLWNLSEDRIPQSFVSIAPKISASDWMDIASIEWSRNGRWLLTDGSDGNSPSQSIIRLWDATTGEAIRTIYPAFNPVWGPSDQEFAGLSIENNHRTINIWDTNTGEVLSSFKAPDNGIFNLSWNFDSNMLAGIPLRSFLILWDVDTGERYDFPEIRTPFVGSVAWRPHSNQLAIADLDRGVLILDFVFED